MQEFSPTGKTIIALLNNVSELVVVSNERKEAEDVMRATHIYAKSKNFSMPDDKINNFYARLLDARPLTIQGMVMDIAKDVVNKEIAMAKGKKSIKPAK